MHRDFFNFANSMIIQHILVMKWRKFNRNLHRDLGYLFVGLTLIYAISGIALNHLHHWNPDLKTIEKSGEFSQNFDFENNRNAAVQKIVAMLEVDYPVKNSMVRPTGNIKVFLDVGKGNTGTILIDPEAQTYDISILKKRPLLREMNLMHRNNFKKVWTWVSDIYGLGLIILAITGMIILRGKRGFKRYGVWWVAAGIIVPLIIVLIYL